MSVAHHPSSVRKRRGFTLIEMAMVLAIFGFIVAGTLAASSLTRDAALRNVAKELADLRRAVQIYQERYNSFPGDTSDASGLFACSGCNGNGNGRIDLASDDPAQALLEQRLFWEHLSRAGLIKFTLSANSRNIGKVYPPSAAGSGAALTIEGRKPDRVVAVIHLIQITAADGSFTETSGSGPLTPEEAERIDRMIDDGSPSNGQMVVEEGNGVTAGACRDATTRGYAANVGRKCNAAFILAGRSFQNAKSKSQECRWSVTPTTGTTPGGEWSINAINGAAGTTYNNGTPDMGYSACSQSCGDGVQSRTVSCNSTASGTLSLNVDCVNVAGATSCSQTVGVDCLAPKPPTSRPFTGCTTTPPPSQKACNLGTCANAWDPGAWSACKDSAGVTITVGDWELSDWGECSATCGSGTQYRTASCRSRTGIHTRTPTCASGVCDGVKPSSSESCTVSSCGSSPAQSQSCNAQPCGGWVAGPWGSCAPLPFWDAGSWTTCDNTCGGGFQTRSVSCNATGSVQTRTVYCPSGATCVPGDKPATTQACPASCAGQRPPESQSCANGSNWGDIFNSTSHIYRMSADPSGWMGCIAN